MRVYTPPGQEGQPAPFHVDKKVRFKALKFLLTRIPHTDTGPYQSTIYFQPPSFTRLKGKMGP